MMADSAEKRTTDGKAAADKTQGKAGRPETGVLGTRDDAIPAGGWAPFPQRLWSAASVPRFFAAMLFTLC